MLGDIVVVHHDPRPSYEYLLPCELKRYRQVKDSVKREGRKDGILGALVSQNDLRTLTIRL